MCVCVCVFFPFILDIKFVGRTSRGHTGGRSHRRNHRVGTLVPVEPLGDACTGPLFTLWEGLYRCFTNPVGALLGPLTIL